MTPPEVLYHYTTQAGLLGILTSGTIWASQVQFLNDSTEFRIGLEIATEQLHAMARLSRTGANALTRSFAEYFRSIENFPVFVVSLTAEGDQLSQWRAYSGTHSGFSLALDTEQLMATAAANHFSLHQCTYDETSQRNLIAELFSGYFGARARPGLPDFSYSLAALCPLLKNAGFAEEREWRLVSERVPTQLHFRPGRSLITPYCAIPLVAADGTSCVKGLTVGPTPHPELAIEAVRSLARSCGRPDIAVNASKIPLRTW